MHNEFEQLLQKHDDYLAIAKNEIKQQRQSAKTANTTLAEKNEAAQRAHNHQLMKNHDMVRTPMQSKHVNNVISQETTKAEQLDILFNQQKINALDHSIKTKSAKQNIRTTNNEIATFMQQHHLGKDPKAAFKKLTQQRQQLQNKSDKLGDNIVNCDKQIKKQHFVVKQHAHEVKSAQQQLHSCQKTYHTITDKVEQLKKQEKILHHQIDEASHLQKVLNSIDKKN